MTTTNRPSFARSQKWAIMQFLQSDLYTVDHQHPGNQHATEESPAVTAYVSPLKWTCLVGGTFDEPSVEIIDPSGKLYRKLERTTVEQVDQVLP